MIKLENVCKRYGSMAVLRNVTLEIATGGITALIGPNASGKTTLLKTILGFVRPDAGVVTVNGQNIALSEDYRARVGYMPQYAGFPENLTVAEVVELVKKLRATGATPDDELFAAFQLQQYLQKKCSQLSGGTRQKLSAYLTTLYSPELLILDEPTASLDPYAGILFKEYLQRKARDGRSVVITSHNLHELEEIADRIIFLLEGVVCFTGSSEELTLKTNETTLERAIASILEKGLEQDA